MMTDGERRFQCPRDLEQVRSGLAHAYLTKDARNGRGRRLPCKQDEKDVERFMAELEPRTHSSLRGR